MDMNDVWDHLTSIRNELASKWGTFSAHRFLATLGENDVSIPEDTVSFKIWNQHHNEPNYQPYTIRATFENNGADTIEVDIIVDWHCKDGGRVDCGAFCVGRGSFTSIKEAFTFVISMVTDKRNKCEGALKIMRKIDE